MKTKISVPTNKFKVEQMAEVLRKGEGYHMTMETTTISFIHLCDAIAFCQLFNLSFKECVNSW